MIRDRGRIKWTSMMLPEHVKMLRDWVKEDTYEYKKQLDEQQLEQMNETISGAMEFDQLVTISHYHSHNYEIVVGKIHYWDALGGKLHIVDRFEEVHQIKLTDIYDVRLAD
ncbi:YolD-like family protein [Neobacillus sp. LXY-4]|uniref:YolD-like family protein n=1 Tax=Neobacillus sp. LXY-4 TaxID=3379826 RepID=UPI003EE04AF1